MKLFFNPNLKNFSQEKDYENNQIIRRLFLVVFFMTAIGLLIFSKIIEIAMLYEKELVNSSKTKTENNNLFRGVIKDRNGKILASNIFKYKLKAYPRLINDPVLTSEILTQQIPNLDKRRIYNQVSNKSKFEVVILRNITAKKAKYLNSLGIPGLEFFPSIKRFYPQENLTSHIIGHTNKSLIGVNGIEKTFEKKLSSGEDITLSIDIRVQHAIREELVKDFLAFNAKTATAILADLETNEILSMISLPDFNPNLSINPSIYSYRNTATLNLYEMGSTFKIFSLAAGFEFGDVHLNSNFDVSKPLTISRFTIKDYHPQNRVLNTKEVFLKSSNKGASLIALKLGGNNLKNFYSKLGLLDYSSIDIKEKAKPKYPLKWGKIETANLSFGYGISITPIHLVEATSLIFGNFKFENVNLELKAKKRKDKNNFISFTTREKLLYLMEQNVLYGTGKNAFVKGYGIGGKTATAEKVNKNLGGYDKTKLVSSFLSIFPINKPKYICLVLFDEPLLKNTVGYNDGATGGKTAAKTTAKIIKRIAPLLGIEKENTYEDLLVKKGRKGINFASF
ncbi:MAG: Peptidoglycan synthase FtsI [Alphaproteobacteria bacterium MarineAlpha9_Bin4]|nr:hypothetical protein [Pelagibacterales bacterium]PPR27665.1 MAG: Peptidoglycan synthase FtsI [Alphaproteobacteria bacterium MarineAlpha9_Bin4]